MKSDITKNFNQIFTAISDKGIKRTAFAKAMGYSSTSQLASTLAGKALISTKAVIELIRNLNVNPVYLFTGQGRMFLTEKSEIDELREQITKLKQDKNELARKAAELSDMVKTLEKRNGDLIDITALALKNCIEEEEKKKENEAQTG